MIRAARLSGVTAYFTTPSSRRASERKRTCLDGHLDAVFQHDPHAARQHRSGACPSRGKALHLRDGRQVERLAVDRDIDPDPERGVRDLGEILPG